MDATNALVPASVSFARRLPLHSHLQSASVMLPFRRSLPKGVRHEHIELPIPDDGALVLESAWLPQRAPAVILLHGIAGSSRDAYVVRAARDLLHAGFHTVRVNQRGSGLGMGRASQLYHASFTDDVERVQRFVEARDDVSSVGMLGFSLGAHVALSHAANRADDTGKLEAVAAISAPVDLSDVMRTFAAGRRGLVGMYERLIVRSLVEKSSALRRRLGDKARFSWEDVRRILTILDFDRLITCSTHGFDDVHEMHARTSVGPRLHAIAVPTLAVHASDDPIVPIESLARFSRPKNMELVVTPRGGHIAFVESWSQLFGKSAAVARTIAHFQRHLRTA